MAAKKATANQEKSGQNSSAPAVETIKDTKSQGLAKLATTSALSAITLKDFSGCGNDLGTFDLIVEMKKAGSEAVAGDLGRAERMLANQLLTLDAIFNSLAQKSHKQDNLKGIEALMRLALKAQAQARATAETLSVMKNPMPFIKQANIAHGHQQVNNGQQATGAGNTKSVPNKLLEDQHGRTLDIGAPAAAGRTNPAMEAMGEVQWAEVTERQGKDFSKRLERRPSG